MSVIKVACAEEYVVTITYNAIEMKDTMMLMQIKYEVNKPLQFIYIYIPFLRWYMSPKLGEQYTSHGSSKQCYVYNKRLGAHSIPNLSKT